MSSTEALLGIYFRQHGSISLPGIGGFDIRWKSAMFNTETGMISPPHPWFSHEYGREIPSGDLYAFLANRLQCSEWEAVGLFNTCCREWLEKLNAGGKLEWTGVGILQKFDTGRIALTPLQVSFDFMPDVNVNSLQPSPNSSFSEEADMPIQWDEEEEAEPEKISDRKWIIAVVVLLLLAISMILYDLFKRSPAFPQSRSAKTIITAAPTQYENIISF